MYQPKIYTKPKLYDLDTVITFGKYKHEGLTVQEIIWRDVDYIIWCIEDHAQFDVTPEVLDLVYSDDEISLGYDNYDHLEDSLSI